MSALKTNGKLAAGICSSTMAACILATTVLAADAPKARKLDPELAKQASEAIDKATEYLRKSQLDDGSFAQGENGPSITGILVAGLLRCKHVTVADPMIEKAFKYLEANVRDDGGIYAKGGQKNYPTSICMLAFAEANKDGRYKTVLANAAEFLTKEQWDEGEGISKSSPRFGGAGYGKKSRPDMSNTSFMLEALTAAGLSKDDPAFQRALVFVARCQNLSGEGANDLPQAALINDGGFYYTPAEDYNPGGGTEKQGLRSYASMTYAGLKSFIYCGVDKNDRRFKAAMTWVKKNYSVNENPGLGQQGLFYYYHTFAKALSVLDVDTFEDDKGQKHDWRADLIKTVVAKQNPDGSWTNPNKRWFEDDPRLVTGYALLALGYTQ